MGTRHAAYKAVLDKGYSSEWNDDHVVSFADEVDHVCDFLGDVLTTHWDTAQTAAGSAPVISLVGGAGVGHAFVVLNTGGVTDQTSCMRHECGGAVDNITSIADYPVFTTALQIAAVHTAGNVLEFGFMESGTAAFIDNQDGAYFRILDNTLFAVTGDGAAETATVIGAFTEYAHYRIVMVDVAGTDKIYFYVDNMVTPVATHTENLPDSNLTLKYNLRSKNNVDSTARVEGCALIRNRKTS